MGKAKDRLYLRGRVFWCWGYDSNGKKWAESTHQRDRQAALGAAREIERRYASDSTARSRSKLTLEVALNRVFDFQTTAGRAVGTQRATRLHAEHLAGWLGVDTPLADITLEHTTRYLEERLKEGAHRHTVKKELGALTQAMRRCAKLGMYVPKVDPRHFIPDELGKAYTPRDRWLTKEEYARLVAALQPPPVPGTPGGPERNQRVADGARVRVHLNRADYVVAWCNLGLRKTELFTVQPGDYDARRRELRVRGTKTEKADRQVPVNDAAAEVLERRIAACGVGRCKPSDGVPFPPWHNGNCVRDLKKACALLGIAPVTPNDFRRTFCSWLCQAGVPERTCAELLGHGSTVMVRAVYGHLDAASMRDAVKKL